ncbi:MAG: hypothetical protein H7288_20830, partial [Kineosporiaceae bacterium]|nr:hypothetical protein [Aeromicrobium sp.]
MSFGLLARMVVAVGLLAAVAGCGGASVADFSSPDALGVSLPTVVHPPKTLFTRTMFATATITTVGKQIDKCRGPVSVPLGSNRPVLGAEHDFCGGSAWFSRLGQGGAVDLSGPGVASDIYVVSEIKTVTRDGNATVKDLPKRTL